MAWPLLAGIGKGLMAIQGIKSFSNTPGGLGKVAGLYGGVSALTQRKKMPGLSTPQAPSYNIGGQARSRLGSGGLSYINPFDQYKIDWVD